MRLSGIFLLTLYMIVDCKGGCPFSNNINGDGDTSQHPSSSHRMKRHSEEGVDQATTTTDNCTCKSQCEATIDFGFAKYDWCKTENKCGKWSYTRWTYYDYCKYLDSSKPDNLAKTWETKTNELMDLVRQDEDIGEYPNVLKIIDESINTSFDDEWDTMPAGREKYIHGVGAVCKFTLAIENSPYTGIFKNGVQTGIIRLGSAIDLSGGKGVVPGAGIKFLRTGRSSANFVALNSLDPMPNKNYNFFHVPLMNHISSPATFATKILGRKFKQASDCITKVGLSDLARYDQDGNEEQNLVFPFKVTLVPTGDVQFNEAESSLEEFSRQWGTIPKGTDLYTFMAHSNPNDEGTKLGQVIAVDGCTTSKFGDKNLFFRHQRIEEDIQRKPSWKSSYMTEC